MAPSSVPRQRHVIRLGQRSSYLGGRANWGERGLRRGLGAIAYGAELCYLGAIGYGAEQRVQK
jgi:hypothetical protein